MVAPHGRGGGSPISFIARLSAVLAFVAVAAAGCSSSTSTGDEDFATGDDSLNVELFRQQTEVVGTLDIGSFLDVSYTNPRKYRGLSISLARSQQVDLTLATQSGSVVVWLLDERYRVVARGDGPRVTITYSARTSGMFLLAFRERDLSPTHVSVSCGGHRPPPRPPQCQPKTCSSATQTECGTHDDGCGGTLSCGACANGDCRDGLCVNGCQPRACPPAQTCGNFYTGCGVISCGTCAENETCGFTMDRPQNHCIPNRPASGTVQHATPEYSGSASSGTPDMFTLHNVVSGHRFSAQITGTSQNGGGTWSVVVTAVGGSPQYQVMCNETPTCSFVVPNGVHDVNVTAVTTDIGNYQLKLSYDYLVP